MAFFRNTEQNSDKVDLTAGGSYQWTINFNTSLIAQNPRFIFRFKPHVSDKPVYAPGSPWGQYSSGFLVLAGPVSTTSSSAPSAVITPSSSSAVLSTGAKAGIAAGAGVGGLALIALIVFFCGRYQITRRPHPDDVGVTRDRHSETTHYISYLRTSKHVPELEGRSPIFPARGEMPDSQVKSSRSELSP
jgi:hypothetical protein